MFVCCVAFNLARRKKACSQGPLLGLRRISFSLIVWFADSYRSCPSRFSFSSWLDSLQRAGFFNPLTRKIVFVRPCVRPCVCTPFPYCDFATFHFLFGNRRNRRFSNKKCVASLRPTSYLKSGDFGRKYAILRLISYLKSDYFGRKYAMLDENT